MTRMGDYRKYMAFNTWPINAERWTDEQLDDIQNTLNRYGVGPLGDFLFAAASDAIGSLRFDKVDLAITMKGELRDPQRGVVVRSSMGEMG